MEWQENVPNHGEMRMPNQVETRVQVFHAGVGKIEPTGEVSTGELVEAMDESQKPIEDPHVVCIDGRRSEDEPQPVREKLAGGNLTTFLYAASAMKWSLFQPATVEAGPDAMVEEAADFLVKAGEALGAHEGDCGAIGNAVSTTENISVHGNDEEWVSQAEKDLGDDFNLAHWQEAVEGFTALSHNPAWRGWRTSRIQEVVREHDGVVEKLDNQNHRPDKDPDNKRRNHWEEGVKIGTKKGYSNDRDHARIPFFQADADPMIRMAQKAASSQEEYSRLLHAELLFQYGTTYTLTKNQPIVR